MSPPPKDRLDGFFILDKAEGFTSQDAVRKVSRGLNIAKLGHSGTLDRFATGVLPLLAGRYTRLMRFFMEGPKAYLASLAFGSETSTLDPEGEVIATAPCPQRADVEALLPGFRGQIMQSPPEFSAVHIDGKRAWRRRLAGEEVVMPPRPVRIDTLEIQSWGECSAVLFVECSKGTYIRSLARDIARSCGSRAHLSALRRTRAAGFPENEAIPMEHLSVDHLTLLEPKIAERMGLSTAILREGRSLKIMNGKSLSMDDFDGLSGSGPYWAAFEGNNFLAILRGLESACPAYEAVIGGMT